MKKKIKKLKRICKVVKSNKILINKIVIIQYSKVKLMIKKIKFKKIHMEMMI